MIKKIFQGLGLLILLFVGLSLLEPKDLSDSNFKVHYIDVGQGDSILIQIDNKNILIDSGPPDERDKLISYLTKIDVNSFDYIIATHPHLDHIGNLPELIDNYEIGEFYMSNVLHTTPTYSNMLEALSNNKVKVKKVTNSTAPLKLSKDCTLEFIMPKPIVADKENSIINNQSIVLKLYYKDTTFLFTGDIEKEAEKSLIDMKVDLKSDVLKVPHHGSNTSSTKAFLDAVSPNYGIISVGEYNNFNHPTTNVLNRLKDKYIKIYRTDNDGTIVVGSDGTDIYIK